MKPLKIFFLIIPVLLVACGTPQQAAQKDGEPVIVTPDKPVTQPAVEQDESFDPLSLNDYDFSVKESKAAASQAADIDAILGGNNLAEGDKVAKQIPGFRVQLISTRDIEESQSVFHNAVISFSEKVYRTYSDPYYKIRVGDFTNRQQANDLQAKALESGFIEAWVVKTMVWTNPGVVKENDLP